MNILKDIGKQIRNKRLSLNLRMEDISKDVGISRASLSSIENGSGNPSFSTVLKICDVLGLSIDVSDVTYDQSRKRATRIIRALDKKINRFVIFTVEQYASSKNKSSHAVYNELKEKGLIEILVNDYEDMHGMSTIYLNDYIDAYLKVH